MKKILCLGIMALMIAGSIGVCYGQTAPNEIKALIVENMKVTQDEDVDAMMNTIHTQSPVYLATKNQIGPLFKNYDLKYELLSYKFIGVDGEYALARVKQLTEKVSGPAFQNNEIDMIQVFKKENNKWKFWNQVILEIKYL